MSPEIVDPTENTPWKHLERLLEAGDEDHLDEYIGSLSTADRIHAFSRLDPDMQAHLMLLVSAVTAAGIFEDLPESQATALIERIDVNQAGIEAVCAPLGGALDAAEINRDPPLRRQRAEPFEPAAGDIHQPVLLGIFYVLGLMR